MKTTAIGFLVILLIELAVIYDFLRASVYFHNPF